MRFLPVGLNAMLVELADLGETLALHDSLGRQPIAAIDEVVPAARTLLIRYRAEVTSAGALARDIAARDLTTRSQASGELVEIPVRYDGEDLADVAALLAITPEEVVRRHSGNEYRVAFTGFAPGFAYMTSAGAGLDVPRRKTPRTRVPAGAVGLAGPFSGIYPRSSPGGWQIIGTTPLAMFDLARDEPALLRPGNRVRFRAIAELPEADAPPPAVGIGPAAREAAGAHAEAGGLRVLSAAMPALFQDLGRQGQAAQGVGACGALDTGALKAANRAVGNPPETACLEITLGGFSFEALGKAVIALAGADAPLAIRDAAGRSIAAAHGRPVGLNPGDVVALAAPTHGLRSYLAVRGGFAIAPVLGSASTDTLSGLGPDPVGPGDFLGILARSTGPAVSLDGMPAFEPPAAGDSVTLDVVLGPRSDWFEPSAIELLAAQDWQVTPASNRVGLRLAGVAPLVRAREDELPSEGVVAGAIQVPPSGQPVLFLADHPLTGGYPVIAVVAPRHLDLAGQIPIGAAIRFNPVRPFEEITPA